MMLFKTSLCVTVFNEEITVGLLLDSLANQTAKVDEIVIVDGGSSDKTIEIIKHYQKKFKNIKLLIEPGNVAHGRNTAIELAKNNVIAMIDAGCVAKEDWLEKITLPFKNEHADIVAGYYIMRGESPIQKAVSVFLGIPPQRYDNTNFLPSARSICFKKEVWEGVGGFSEKLSGAGEDTLFNYKAIKKGYNLIRVKDAIVYWEIPKTLKESLKKFFNYARGDVQTKILWNSTQGLSSHNIKILFIFLRYLVGVILLIYSIKYTPLFWVAVLGFFVYLFWSVWKWRDVVLKWRERVWLPTIQVSSDFAIMAGFISGIISLWQKKRKKHLKV